MKIKCIKGIVTSNDTSIVCMRGDVLKMVDTQEGEVFVEGVSGFCRGLELCFTPKEIIGHFESIES